MKTGPTRARVGAVKGGGPVGVWHEPDLDSRERADLRLALADPAARALDTGEVEVILLNGPRSRFATTPLRRGVRLLERDHPERIRLETRALLD